MKTCRKQHARTTLPHKIHRSKTLFDRPTDRPTLISSSISTSFLREGFSQQPFYVESRAMTSLLLLYITTKPSCGADPYPLASSKSTLLSHNVKVPTTGLPQRKPRPDDENEPLTRPDFQSKYILGSCTRWQEGTTFMSVRKLRIMHGLQENARAMQFCFSTDDANIGSTTISYFSTAIETRHAFLHKEEVFLFWNLSMKTAE